MRDDDKCCVSDTAGYIPKLLHRVQGIVKARQLFAAEVLQKQYPEHRRNLVAWTLDRLGRDALAALTIARDLDACSVSIRPIPRRCVFRTRGQA